MPRNKSKTPKRLACSNEDDGPVVSSKKRRRSSFGNWRRKIVPLEKINLPYFTISLAWRVSEDNTRPSFIQIVEDSDEKFVVTAENENLEVSQETAQNLRQNMTNILFIFITSTKNELQLGLALKYLPFLKAQPLVEMVFSKDYSNYSDCTILGGGSTNFSIFKELESLQRLRPTPDKNMQLEELKPQLRDYQTAAVDWMLERESSPGTLSLRWLSEVVDEFSSSNGHCLLYNKYAKSLYPPFDAVSLSSGGILADEMGLGKTVVTLALLLHNKRNNVDTSWEMVPTCLEEEDSDDDTSDSDSSEPTNRILNQENCLDANEQLQLVPCRGNKGILRSKLQEWYESQLSGFRATPSRPLKHVRNKFKCTCGDHKGKKKKVVTCNSCKHLQHETCCGCDSKYLYLCPSCWKKQSVVPSKATLVIVPPAIFTQWNNEILLHAPSLKTFLYSGIKDRFVQPLSMADNDVVITTYNVLRAETSYASDVVDRSLRNEGRFLRSSSPLERISWWRIVCDEAQMVESDLSLVRQMTDRLQAVHRWCVTGTPIQRSVADLYFLTSFTGLGVFDNKDVWMDFLMKPYMAQCKLPLLSVLSQVFWRSTKEVVEASLPEQTFVLHYLNFSAIEEVFYMQQHSQSAGKFYRGLIKAGVDLSLTLDRVDKRLLKGLLQPLLNVRQACTHAQVVNGICINSSSGAANLGELSDYLYRKAKQECEEALRLHIAALNGLAGLHWFSDVNEALKNYRTVLRTADECRGEVQVDVLQRIHALNGAAIILESNPNVENTLRDDRLRLDAEELEKKYLSKSEEIFASSLAQTENLTKDVKLIRNSFESSPSAWWTLVILSLSAFEKELIDKLNEELHSNDPNEKTAAKEFLKKIVTLHNVEITINNWWKSLEKCYKHVETAMATLIKTSRKILMEEALNCHLRSTDDGIQCTLCSVEKTLQDLECELFATSRKVTKKREKGIDGAETKGSWKPHNVERTLSIVLGLARTKVNLEKWCLDDGKRHAKLLEAMKKEFKQLRAVWTALNHCIHAEDELIMAKQRIELSSDKEKTPKRLTVPKGEKLLRVSPYQLPQMLVEFENERDSALSDFNKKKGRMMYLQNLSKDRSAAVDPCPICKSELELQWCVLYCGHCLCLHCLQQLLPPKARRVKCPVCREYTDDSDVSFVDITGNADTSDDVIGDYSTKVDNIVRQALKLLKVDPAVKILIFSSWTEVLKILSKALLTNKISFVSLPSNKHQEVLQKFLDKSGGVSVLLLPFAWGSKGLNLIEATHVFLVEPILNPAEELQAIGRVHRIGQTKFTYVHRFIVRRTIEEKIFGAVSEARDKWSSNTVTLGDLLKLFSTRNE